jgi:hypothetical protein
VQALRLESTPPQCRKYYTISKSPNIGNYRSYSITNR